MNDKSEETIDKTEDDRHGRSRCRSRSIALTTHFDIVLLFDKRQKMLFLDLLIRFVRPFTMEDFCCFDVRDAEEEKRVMRS